MPEFLDLGGQIDVLYTDLEKAFDKIPHKRLTSKLHSYGLNNGIIDWIEAFLTNRKQRVGLRIKQSYSKWALVISGVPRFCFRSYIIYKCKKLQFIQTLTATCSE